MKWRALALGATIGFALATVASCDQTQRARCTRANCTGCCDAEEQCQAGNVASACGTGAVSCQVCGATQSCVEGQCRGGTGTDGGLDGGTDGGSCGPQSCASGCCLNNQCLSGTNPAACGKNGGVCAVCPGTQSCEQQQCTGASCPGCVDANTGNCLTGNSNAACGLDGGLCRTCNTAIGESCTTGTCVAATCNATNCASGCCSGATCITPPTNAQCGKGGAACVSCQGQDTCTDGACGRDGGPDFDGGPDYDGGWPFDGGLCDSSLCPTGCCTVFGTCFAQPNDFQCGISGSLCQSCSIALKKCDKSTGTCK